MMSPLSLPQELLFLETPVKTLGFNGLGYSRTTNPLSFTKYQDWIEKGYQGEMQYLEKHLTKKENLTLIHPLIKSIFSLTHPYRILTHENKNIFSSLKIALYAQDEDYHDWLKQKLDKVVQELQKMFPQDYFMAATDIYPILERDYGYQNRLGWIGKNSCLIHPKEGSLFLIGNILSSLDIPHLPTPPLHDFCGKCTKCIDSCPTSAISADRTLNSTKCISYWTIESKKIAPLELRPQIGEHFFGCDICQTVCPWNGKILNQLLPLPSDQDHLRSELKFILTASPATLKEKTQSTALSRSKAFGLKRNALIIIGNLKFKELKNEVTLLLKDEKLNELAQWVLKELR